MYGHLATGKEGGVGSSHAEVVFGQSRPGFVFRIVLTRPDIAQPAFQLSSLYSTQRQLVPMPAVCQGLVARSRGPRSPEWHKLHKDL